MLRGVELSIGTTEIAPGYKAEVTPKFDLENKPKSETSIHETRHGVAGIKNGSYVRRMSIIPGPGYLGITELDRFDAIAFMAPHAAGCDGTGHDVSVVAYMGHNPGVAAGAANALL